MDNPYILFVLFIAALPLIPAFVVMGGFTIGLVISLLLLITLLGGPKWWELYNNQNMGSKGRKADLRDMIGADERRRK